MSETVICSIIAGVLTAIPAILTCVLQNGATRTLVEYRLAEIEKKVSSRDGFDNRITIIETELKSVLERIEKEHPSGC